MRTIKKIAEYSASKYEAIKIAVHEFILEAQAKFHKKELGHNSNDGAGRAYRLAVNDCCHTLKDMENHLQRGESYPVGADSASTEKAIVITLHECVVKAQDTFHRRELGHTSTDAAGRAYRLAVNDCCYALVDMENHLQLG